MTKKKLDLSKVSKQKLCMSLQLILFKEKIVHVFPPNRPDCNQTFYALFRKQIKLCLGQFVSDSVETHYFVTHFSHQHY